MQLESMYQEIILDHYRNPHHKGLREPFDAEVHHVNPVCGDEVTLRVTLKDVDGEPVVEDLSYDSLGCSISQASASVMSDLVIGKPVGEAMRISQAFLELMQSRGDDVTRRGRARGRGGVRGRVQVPGQDQVRAAGLDGVEGRDRAGHGGRTNDGEHDDQDTAPQETGDFTGELTPEQEDVLEALRDVVDPELGINVVDLGLVYGVDVDAERVATIDMTLTSAACPLTDVIEDQARDALDGVVTDFRINWVWMPPWGPESITEDGREQLRALGFNI